jgi:hypothetical protein
VVKDSEEGKGWRSKLDGIDRRVPQIKKKLEKAEL